MWHVCVFHVCLRVLSSVLRSSLPPALIDNTCHNISIVLLDTGSVFSMLTFPYGGNNGCCVCVCVCVDTQVCVCMPNLCTKACPSPMRHSGLCLPRALLSVGGVCVLMCACVSPSVVGSSAVAGAQKWCALGLW